MNVVCIILDLKMIKDSEFSQFFLYRVHEGLFYSWNAAEETIWISHTILARHESQVKPLWVGRSWGIERSREAPGPNPGVFIFQQWWTNHLCASISLWALGLQLCAAMSSWFVLIRGHLCEGCAQGTGPFGPSASVREN